MWYKMDALCDRLDVFKMETIGDAFMATADVAVDQSDSHVKFMAEFALEALQLAASTSTDEENRSLGTVQLVSDYIPAPLSQMFVVHAIHAFP